MKLLSRAQIVAAKDLKHEDVEVPEWGGTVRLRELTGEERDRFEAANINIVTELVDGKEKTVLKRNTENLRARLVAMCMIDGDGNRFFGDDEIADLGRKGAQALQKLFLAAQRLNGIGEPAVKEAEKNSTAAPSGEST